MKWVGCNVSGKDRYKIQGGEGQEYSVPRQMVDLTARPDTAEAVQITLAQLAQYGHQSRLQELFSADRSQAFGQINQIGRRHSIGTSATVMRSW